MKPWLTAFTVMGLLLSLGGCNVFLITGNTPTASDHLVVPSDMSNQRFFDCAESSISKLSETNSSWQEVTLKDSANGVLESGNFDEKNIAGFRARIERAQGTSEAQIVIKGGGAYFIDLGVAQAIKDLRTTLASCVSSPP
ncbi:phospholipase C [Pseudomonas viridiflava]|uniref:hypothetical protein n=1 Tax=Pseudomonas syringae TaxID=317 RepID=UPI000BB5EA9B|nr:hypothetical protein [Pseudomonas syringae]PBP86147.1 hypothetical protein CCL22_02290 [Pseudomonas syringae]